MSFSCYLQLQFFNRLRLRAGHYKILAEQQAVNVIIMIKGIGIDMIEIERVAASINKKKGFRELVFSKKEIAYCEKKTNKFEHYAARFAAKEAFFKAMGTGWGKGTAFNEIEIRNNKAGKPEISFLGKTAITIAEMKPGKIFVSLSHLKTMASAMVIIESI